MTDTDWASETEQRILDSALPLAAERGWSGDLAVRAGRALGFSRGEVELLLPHGARDLAALLSQRHDRAGLEALKDVDPAALKVRERIRAGAGARLDAALVDEAAVRRCMGFLALPGNAPLALRLAWTSADSIWRWAGDTATDENHYSKRAILAGVLTSTLAVAIASGRDAALSNLDARIQNVMDFEKWKAGIRPSAAVERVAGLLARLRYGRRTEPAG